MPELHREMLEIQSIRLLCRQGRVKHQAGDHQLRSRYRCYPRLQGFPNLQVRCLSGAARQSEVQLRPRCQGYRLGCQRWTQLLAG